jgi:hypothetical protein
MRSPDAREPIANRPFNGISSTDGVVRSTLLMVDKLTRVGRELAAEKPNMEERNDARWL